MSFRFTTRSLFALAGGVAWALAASCGSNDDSCSTHGCHDQFAIEFVKDGWTEGTYDVELDIDGEVVQCQFVLPIPEEGLTFCPPVSDGPLASTSIEFWVIRGDTSRGLDRR
jgi:hypothetical protein